MTSGIQFLNEEMRIICSTKKMKKFDVLVKMKILIDCKKKSKYITLDELWVIYPYWILDYGTKKMEITCEMKEMEKFDVL